MKTLAAAFIASTMASSALAQPIIVSDSGDTAWLLIASVLMLLTVLPGLALFHGGQVRAKNVVTVAIHGVITVATVSLLWVVAGYSLVFGEGSPWLGGTGNIFLRNLAELRADTTVPESAFALFQMTLAILASVLVVGAFVERARLGWVIGFGLLWSLLVYVPVARWIWGSGWLSELGALDFAGGIVVQTTAGVGALVGAFMIKRRRGAEREAIVAHNPALALAGAGLVWVGWFALIGGSALGASEDASTAILNAHFAACAAVLAGIAVERARLGRVSGIGIASGAIAGLATISAGAGYVGPIGAILLGAIGGALALAIAPSVRQRLRIDDALNLFAVHGVGGIVGALLFPLFVVPVFGGPGFEDGLLSSQLAAQAIAVAVATLWAGLMTWLICFAWSFVAPLRVSEEEEHQGLDVAVHGGSGWDKSR